MLKKLGESGESVMTLTKAELADLLFEKVGLNKREAKDMVEAFFEEIRGALERGESVKLSGFGNFQLRDKPQRPGRNPKTGEEIPISARRVVTFHASQKLKAMVAARAALLGAGVHAAQAGQAPRQPALLPAPRSAADPPHPRAAV
jgi:integration host factor subunit alpha